MALQIWLPLNGNLNNQGLTNITVTNSGTTVDTSGKIGSCYNFDGASCIKTNYVESFGTGDFSLCAWIYLVQTSGKTYQQIIGNKSTGGTSVGCAIYWNQTQKKFLWSTADGTNATEIWTSDTFDDIIYDSWHHIAMIRNNSDSSKGYFYIDGVRKNIASVPAIRNISSSTSTFSIGQCNNSTTAAYYFTGKINDVRVYDHALSPREVAEIAKGLVLHYPLNREGFGQDNLHKNSYALTTNWTLDQATVSNGVATITPTTNSDRRIYQMPANGGWTWQANTKYTASIEAKSSDGGKLVFCPYGGNASNSSAIDVTSEWKRYSYSFTTSSSPTTGSMTYSVSQSSGVTLQLRLPKLELGEKATPWMPHSSDTLYSAMGLNSNIVYDCSGYKHDGTLSGVSYDQETPRYSVAMKFPENASTVTVSPCFSSGQTINEMSVSVWFKTNTLNSTAPNMFSLGENSFFRARIANATGVWYYIRVGTTQCASTYACKTLTDNLWHLFTITFNNGVVCVYIDGAQVGTTNHSSTATYLTCSNVGTTWHLAGYTANSENFIGSLSDFRVYTTALTAQQVLELYQTPISLAYNGVLLSAELQE